MSENIAKDIAEDLLQYNPLLKNQVLIICRNNLSPGKTIQDAAYGAIKKIPKAEYLSVIRTLEEDDLIDIFKAPVFHSGESGGQIIMILLASAIMKGMKVSVMSSSSL